MNLDAKINIKKLFIIALVIVSGVIGVSRLFDGYNKTSKNDVQLIVNTTADSTTELQETTVTLFAVHIDGVVVRPGVYYVSKGMIVNDVLMMAGGPKEEADLSLINLAQGVYAGMKIMIYKEGEAVIEGNVSTALVNINTADKATLMTLAGIGESRAESIIQYRNEHGPFDKIEDIMNISGIKESMFNKIKDRITV